MTDLEDAFARACNAEVRHLELCGAYDRGEPVGLALRQAELDWIKAKNAAAALESAAS